MLKILFGLILVTAAYLFYPNPLFQRGIYLFGGIALAMGWVNQTVRKGISVAVDMRRGRGFPGENLSLTLKIKNESIVPVFWCGVRQTFSEGIGAFCEQWVLSLHPHSQREIKMAFRGQRRGVYPIPRTQVVLGDAWGFHESALNYDFSEQIVIYPSVDPVVGLTLDRHLPLGPHTRRFGLHEDPARLRGCR
ncbi:MAG TPA: hypothetical protein VHR47_06715, partial [Bacillota bacterium]|nr:hypothetical protein [Bacillota bacterium]